MKGHLEERVYKRLVTDPGSGCLLWTGALDAAGYGRVWDSRTRTQTRIHRLMWELVNGPVPDGMEIDHVKERGCQNRHCANVAHLELVTHAENRHRAIKTHCINGHELSPENIYTWGHSRTCRQCRKDRKSSAPQQPNARRESWETLAPAVRRETAKRRAS